MECFDDVHTGGGKIESFVSYCGGLPAPEASVKNYCNIISVFQEKLNSIFIKNQTQETHK